MEELLASAEKVKEHAEGGLRDSSDKHIKTIRWNLDFLQGKSHGLQAQPKASAASPNDEKPQAAQNKAAWLATDHPQAEKIAELAENKLRMKLGVKRELKGLAELLAEDEEVLNLARGEYDDRQGLVVVTDRRVLFTEQGMARSRLEFLTTASVRCRRAQGW